MKKLLLLVISAGLLVFSSCDTLNTKDTLNEGSGLKSGHMVMTFKAHLTGSQEVSPVETMATGEAIFKLSKDGTMLSYKVIVTNIENVTASHIHMAPAGVNGGVVVPLYTGGLIEGKTNGILAEGDVPVNQDLIDAMMAGNTYVNVHTTAHPGGELRGQISAN